MNEYDLVVECYLNNPAQQSNLFDYIQTNWSTWNEQQRMKIQEKIFEHFSEIIQINACKSYELFCIFFQMGLAKVLKLINKNEPAQYAILKVIIPPIFLASSSPPPPLFRVVSPISTRSNQLISKSIHPIIYFILIYLHAMILRNY